MKNQLVKSSEKLMTLKEVADMTGVKYRTIAKYAHDAGWTVPRKLCLLNERQVAVIVEAMKSRKTGGACHKRQGGETVHNVMQRIETTESRAVRIAALAKQQHEIDLQIQSELKAEIADLKARLAPVVKAVADKKVGRPRKKAD